MILGKVISRVVSTAKLDALPHRQLLNVEPLEGFVSERTASGEPVRVIAIDTVSAGPGDLVLVLQEGYGRAAGDRHRGSLCPRRWSW